MLPSAVESEKDGLGLVPSVVAMVASKAAPVERAISYAVAPATADQLTVTVGGGLAAVAVTPDGAARAVRTVTVSDHGESPLALVPRTR